jgi:hypothetical protein
MRWFVVACIIAGAVVVMPTDTSAQRVQGIPLDHHLAFPGMKRFDKRNKSENVHKIGNNEIAGGVIAVAVGMVAYRIAIREQLPFGAVVKEDQQKIIRALEKQDPEGLSTDLQGVLDHIVTSARSCKKTTTVCMAEALNTAGTVRAGHWRGILSAINDRLRSKDGLRALVQEACPVVSRLWALPENRCITAIGLPPTSLAQTDKAPPSNIKPAYSSPKHERTCVDESFEWSPSVIKYDLVREQPVETTIGNKTISKTFVICAQKGVTVPSALINNIQLELRTVVFPRISSIFHTVPDEEAIYIKITRLKNAGGVYYPHRPDAVFIKEPSADEHAGSYISIIVHEYVHLLHLKNYHLIQKRNGFAWRDYFIAEGIAKFIQRNYLEKFFIQEPPLSTAQLSLITNRITIMQSSSNKCFLQSRQNSVPKHVHYSLFYELGNVFFEYVHETFRKPMEERYKVKNQPLIFQHLFKKKPIDVWDSLINLSKQVLKKTEHQLCNDFLAHFIKFANDHVRNNQGNEAQQLKRALTLLERSRNRFYSF